VLVPPAATRTGAGCRVTELLAAAATAGRCALLALMVDPGGEPPRHRHFNEDEVIYVLGGEVQFVVGEERLSGRAGTAIYVPRGVDHGFAVVAGPAHLLCTFLPSGFERFYQEIAGIAPDDLDRLIATAARYGCEVTGPPMTPVTQLPSPNTHHPAGGRYGE
jgi:quercetin dioxygenase-like cupin family protein